MSDFKPVSVRKLTGSETIFLDAEIDSPTVLEFWRWAFSNLLSNANRGIFAEFLIARALDLETGVRDEWAPYDLETEAGLRIEVKASSYLQSWEQTGFSAIRFSIQETKSWNTKTRTYSIESSRQADVYVFALLTHMDRETVNPLDGTQWEFYVLPTATLNNAVGNQKSIGLRALRRLCSACSLVEAKKMLEYMASSLS